MTAAVPELSKPDIELEASLPSLAARLDRASRLRVTR